MATKLEAFIERTLRAKSSEDLNREILSLRDIFEVEHLVYHSVNSTGEQYALLTYSNDWVNQYMEQGYLRVDPVVQGCFRRFHPVDWKQLDWTGKPQRQFLGEAVAAGVGSQGFSAPIRGPNGQFALFTVSDRRNDDDWAKLTAASTQDMVLAAHFINQRALEIEGNKDIHAAASLSPREVDALTMLAMGQSRAQAAEKLAISEHTLRVYIESARHKLGAQNTTHAVARALTLGLCVL